MVDENLGQSQANQQQVSEQDLMQGNPQSTQQLSPDTTHTQNSDFEYEGRFGKASNKDELVDYVKKLEDKVATQTITQEVKPDPKPSVNEQLYNIPAQEPEQTQQNQAPKEEELLFEDPKAFVDKVKKEVVDSVRQEEVKRENVNNFWNNFYKTNPNLKNHDSTVKMIMNSHLQEIGNLPVDQAAKKIAQMANNHISEIGASLGVNKETMERTNTESLSGNDTGHRPAPTPEPPANFTQQLKEFKQAKFAAT